MPHRPSHLTRSLNTLRERIDDVVASAPGRNRALRRRLYLEFLTVLNGAGEFDQIPACIPNTAGLAERISRRVGAAGRFALPRAAYEAANYGASAERYVHRGELHASEWDFMTRLARDLNVDPSYGQEFVDSAPAWMIDVDEQHQEMRVWIRELALQDMLLAAMEAFLVPAGAGVPSTEVYGLVFGSMREWSSRARRNGARTMLDLNVERVCIQHRAKGTPSEVVAEPRSEATHLAIGEELFPFWHLLGDFHTHMYRTLGELIRQQGWEFSGHDERENIAWCESLREINRQPRVAFILALTRAGRQGQGSAENWRGHRNVVRATLGRCHCFISAYAIRPDGRYSRRPVTLKCPHLVGY